MATDLVFITGATGFIGSHVAAATLAAGYRVRLSVRREAQIAPLRRILTPSIPSSDTSSNTKHPQPQLEFIVLPTLTVKTPESDDQLALTAALAGARHVFHLASPMVGRAGGPDFAADYVGPAVEGTLNVLEAARAVNSDAGGGIDKVVLMSSVFALMPWGQYLGDGEVVKDNTDTPLTVDLAAPLPDDLPGHFLRYTGSKILAHQASLDWLRANTPSNNKLPNTNTPSENNLPILNPPTNKLPKNNHPTQPPPFTTITLHPTFVLGPSLIQETAADITGANFLFWSSLKQQQRPLMPSTFVDVRDVAETFVRILSTPSTPLSTPRKSTPLSQHSSDASSRSSMPTPRSYILAPSPPYWGRIAGFVAETYPQLSAQLRLEPPFECPFRADATRAERELGLKWRDWRVTVGDVVAQQLRLEGEGGWKGKSKL